MNTEPKTNLLLVDDRPENLLALEAALEPLGTHLFSASSGEAALQLACAHEFAAILLDVQMPGLDGFETASRLRALERARQTPILFITATQVDEQQIATGYALGAVDYILKPFTPAVLLSKVSACIALLERTRALQARLQADATIEDHVNILVVNDNLAGLLATETSLAKLGMPAQVMSARSGREALSLLLKQTFALILLDVHMPDMDGFEVAALLRKSERYRHIPMLFITATTQAEADITLGYACGAFDFLFLPIAPELLCAKVNAILNQFRQQRLLTRQLNEIEQLNQALHAAAYQLENANVTLEQRVLDRTAALAEANETLRAEVTAHNQTAKLQGTSELRYRRLFESAKDGILILDAETGMIVDVNPFLVELLGHSHQELLGKMVWELGFFKDLVGNQDNFTELQQKGYIRYEDKALETSDGRRIEVEFVSNIYLVNEQKVIQCNIRDITERKRTEAALREKDRLLSESQRIAHIGGWSWDLTGPIQWTDETYRIYGVSPETFTPTSESLVQLLHPEDRPAMQRWIEACAAGQSPGELEFRCVWPDGTVRFLNGRGELMYDAGNRPVHMAGTVQDITERKQADEQLRLTAHRLGLATESALIGIWDLDLEKNALTWDKRMYELYGIRPEDFSGASEGWEKCVHPEDLPAARAEVKDAIAGTGNLHTQFRVIWPDGQVHHIEAHATVQHGPDGTPQRMVGVNWDITECKKAEEILMERERISILNADIGTGWILNETLPVVLNKCAKAIVLHLDAAFARIWTLNREEAVLELQASAGIYTHLDGPHGRVPVGKLRIGLIAEERKPHLTNCVIGDSRVGDQEWARREGMVSFAGYPLILEGRLLGVMAMFARHPLNEFTLNALASVAEKITTGIERKRAEEALQASEARLRLVWENALVPLRLTDATGTIVMANPAYCALAGKPREELEGHSLAVVYEAASRDRIEQKHAEWLARGNRIRQETTHVTFWNGRQAILDVTETLFDAPGHPRLLLLAARDVTELRQAEMALRRQTEELRAGNEELTRFNRLTSGRELRVIELKQQVNELSAQLGQPRPYPLSFMDAAATETLRTAPKPGETPRPLN